MTNERLVLELGIGPFPQPQSSWRNDAAAEG